MSKLDKKSQPNDMFAFQRSYPDADFDWKGWAKALVDARLDEQAVQERNASGCSVNTGNWTLQGPGNIGGRVNTLAVKPGDENTVLAGFSAGGIFKTTDGGINWYPVFDEHLELSIGDIIFDPSNPSVVYAGTGDPNMPSIVFNGNGIFKSTDAGETWNYLGLGEQGIISKIQIDPSNPQNLYAATMGNPHKRDNERGIYKSSDGGQNWQQVLFVSNQAGASNLVINPANPQILYASFWDRIRTGTESVIYGPHARVYKTTDGGQNWTQLGGGLPTGTMGRTGLTISAQNPDKVYAVFIDSLSTPGGLFKTTDGGATWNPVNIAALEDKCGDFGWYFGKIALHPDDDEEIYFHAIILWRKAANAANWMIASGGHADSHDLVILPSGRRYWANDGGVYRREPNQTLWVRCKNLPTTQFYHTTYNPHTPDVYWGGAQDNGIKKGNAADLNNWANVYPADGFRCGFHPTDPNTYWVEIQNGTLAKTTDGGVTWAAGQSCLGTTDRCNWDTPFFISSHNPDIHYAATYRAMISPGGGGWSPISDDLTDGIIFGPRFHTVSCLNESPVLAAKLYAGTTDGNVWRREPTSGWVNITAGLPERYVTSVHGSPTLSNRIFVTHSGFRDDEYIPHIHRSDNNGQVWTDISGNLPEVPVNDMLVLPGHADSVLFAATDAGVYFTRNGGTAWSRLGGNMPFVPAFDLELNPVRKELMAATYARGLWTFPLDSVFVQQNAAVVNLAGAIKTETGVGVGNVSLGTQNSAPDGNFVMPNTPGCQTIALAPGRNDNPLNGVSTFDLVLISKHILGLELLNSPWKIIAADANKSNSVTTFDIVTIRKVILGIDSVFAGNTSWRFVPKTFDFPNPANPFQTFFPESRNIDIQTTSLNGIDFTAIKTADVNGNVNPVKEILAEERFANEWPVRVSEAASEREKTIELLFEGEADAIAGVQFTLQFDPELFELQRIEPLLEGLGMEHFGARRAKDGLLNVCFENNKVIRYGFPKKSAGQQYLFRVYLRSKKEDAPTGVITLADTPLPALAVGSGYAALKPVLYRDGHTAKPVVVRFDAWPNPFGTSGLWLQQKTELTTDSRQLRLSQDRIQIYAASGKIVYEAVISANKLLFVPAWAFPAPGTYFYRTDSGQCGKLLYLP